MSIYSHCVPTNEILQVTRSTFIHGRKLVFSRVVEIEAQRLEESREEKEAFLSALKEEIDRPKQQR